MDRGVSWWLFGFPEGGKSIVSLLAWLTRIISMKSLTQIEFLHSNQRDCSDVSPVLPARAVCQSSYNKQGLFKRD